MDCSPPGSSVYGILQARILECVATSSYREEDLPDPGIKTASPVAPVLAGRFFTTEPPEKPNIYIYIYFHICILFHFLLHYDVL